MGRLLLRLGGLLLVGAVAYAVLGEIVLGRTDHTVVQALLAAGAVSLAAGWIARAAGRATAGLVGRSCPRCGRRVKPGRVYCDEHLQETINEYRDNQREPK
jgi:hypothetical protein